jgi:2-dehydropantoate 2-reductase
VKIAIIGPGAMGSLLAAFLTKASSSVREPEDIIWLLDKDTARAAKIAQEGIRVEGIAGNWQAPVKATADVNEIGKADLLIMCVKAYDTKQAITQARSMVDENTLILTLQNGIGNIEIIGEIVGSEKVIGGTANFGATLIGPGNVKYTGKGEVIIGQMDGKITVGMRRVRELFNKAGLETRVSRDIKSVLWSKLIINAGINALSAITGLNNGRLIEIEPAHKILRLAASEAIKVAKRKRIKLFYDDPLAKVEAVCEATSANISSMLQDALKKDRTEIDFINGVIVRQGQELGIPVPVNSMLVDLVKTIEAGYTPAT